jgi:hypothetical protein
MATSIAARFSTTSRYRHLLDDDKRLADNFEEVEFREPLVSLLSWTLEDFLEFAYGKLVWTGPETYVTTNTKKLWLQDKNQK